MEKKQELSFSNEYISSSSVSSSVTASTSSSSLDEKYSIDLEEESEENRGKLKAVVCPILQRTNGLQSVPSINIDSVEICSTWKPPSTHGLINSNSIIPNYYHKNYNEIIDVDYYFMIKDDIRNFRKLNSYQMDFIRQLDDDNKMEIIGIFNDCTDIMSEFLHKESI